MKNQLRSSFIKECLPPLRKVYDHLKNINVAYRDFNEGWLFSDDNPDDNPDDKFNFHYQGLDESTTGHIILCLIAFKRLSDIRGTKTSAAVGWSPDGNPDDCPPFYPGIINHEIKELLDRHGISFTELGRQVTEKLKLDVAQIPGLTPFSEELFQLCFTLGKTKNPGIGEDLNKDELFKEFEWWVVRESLDWEIYNEVLDAQCRKWLLENDSTGSQFRPSHLTIYRFLKLIESAETLMNAWGVRPESFLNRMASEKSSKDSMACHGLEEWMTYYRNVDFSERASFIEEHFDGEETELYRINDYSIFPRLDHENKAKYLEHCEPLFGDPKKPVSLQLYLINNMDRVDEDAEKLGMDIQAMVDEISSLELGPENCSCHEMDCVIQQVLSEQEPDKFYLKSEERLTKRIDEVDLLMANLLDPGPGERILDPQPMAGNALMASLTWASCRDLGDLDLDVEEKLLDPSFYLHWWETDNPHEWETDDPENELITSPMEMSPVVPGTIEIFATGFSHSKSKLSFTRDVPSDAWLCSLRLVLSGLPALSQLIAGPIKEPDPHSINADVAVFNPYDCEPFNFEVNNYFDANSFFTCLSHLNEDSGRMGIVIPSSFLNIDAKTDKEIFENKAQLIREGWLEAVVGLPRGIHKDVEDPGGALLILRHPASKERQAGSQLPGWEKRGKEILFLKFDIEEDKEESREDISRIVSNFMNFEPETDKECLVPAQEIEDNGFDLTPDNYILNIHREMNQLLKSGRAIELKSICEIERGAFRIEGISENKLVGKVPFIKSASQLTGNNEDPYFALSQEHQDQELPKKQPKSLVTRKCILVSRLSSSGLRPTIFDPERHLPAKALLLSKDFASIEVKDSEKMTHEHLFSLLHDNAVQRQVKNLYKDNLSHASIDDLGKIILPISDNQETAWDNPKLSKQLDKKTKFETFEFRVPEFLKNKGTSEIELANQKLEREIEKISMTAATVNHETRRDIMTLGSCLETLDSWLDRVNEKLEREIEKISVTAAKLNHDAKIDALFLETFLDQLFIFLEGKKLLNNPLIENPAEGQDQEFAGKQLEHAKKILTRLKKRNEKLSKIHKATYQKEKYENVDMGELFNDIKSESQHYDNFQVEVKIHLKKRKVPIRRETFVDAIQNVIGNANQHAFQESSNKNKVVFEIEEDTKNVIINCLNNGAPLPTECNEDWFSTPGQRGFKSKGEGYGGSIIEKGIVEAHGGTIKFINKSRWAFHLRLYLPKIEKQKEGQDQGFAEKQVVEEARKVLERIRTRLDNLREIHKPTYQEEKYQSVDVGELFDDIKSGSQHYDNFQIEVKINLKERKVPIRRETFVDAIQNVIGNANQHAFQESSNKNKVVFEIEEDKKNVIINCLNNGAPLPTECNEDWFSTPGQRGLKSNGNGLGGSIIENNIVKAHGGTIKFINKSRWAFHLRLYLPKQVNQED